MRQVWFTAVSMTVLASSAVAQPAAAPTGNLEKLSSFQSTGTVEPKLIPQEGRRADAIRRNLQKVKLPPGFKIDLYAIVPMRAILPSARMRVSFSSARARAMSMP